MERQHGEGFWKAIDFHGKKNNYCVRCSAGVISNSVWFRTIWIWKENGAYLEIEINLEDTWEVFEVSSDGQENIPQ